MISWNKKIILSIFSALWKHKEITLNGKKFSIYYWRQKFFMEEYILSIFLTAVSIWILHCHLKNSRKLLKLLFVPLKTLNRGISISVLKSHYWRFKILIKLKSNINISHIFLQTLPWKVSHFFMFKISETEGKHRLRVDWDWGC